MRGMEKYGGVSVDALLGGRDGGWVRGDEGEGMRGSKGRREEKGVEGYHVDGKEGKYLRGKREEEGK